MTVRHDKQILLLILLIISSFTVVYAYSGAKITIIVSDESGVPVEGARVGVGFYRSSGLRSDENPVVGYTSTSGQFIAAAKTDNNVGFNVKKDGYYMSTGDINFTKVSDDHWEPWNPEIRVVLRKILHPVPMYARNSQFSQLIIPVVNKEVGFDLIKYEWMPPYGNGDHQDLTFKLEGTYTKYNDYDMTLTISFIGKFDGIQTVKEDLSFGSQLKLMRNAPMQGYQRRIVKYVKWRPKKAAENNFEKDNNYIFRVRSEEKNGKLIKAMYGKIQGEVEFYPASPESAALVIKYYLNPDYTQNLEWNGKNLFTNMRSVEQNAL